MTVDSIASTFLLLVLLPLPSLSFVLSMSTNNPPPTRFVTNKMCPYAQKAWIALENIKARYETDEISLYGANGKPDWFLKMNPEGTVPVLSCFGGMTILADSEVILDFIEDGSVEGEDSLALYPADDKRELVLDWREIISTRLAPVGKEAVLGGKRAELIELLKEIDGMVEGPFLCGEVATVADCAAFPFIWRIDQEFGLGEGCEKLKGWVDTCMGEDAFKKTVQSNWWWWW